MNRRVATQGIALLAMSFLTFHDADSAVTQVSYFRDVATFAVVDLASGEMLFDHDEILSQEAGTFIEAVQSFVGQDGDEAESFADQHSTIEDEVVVANGSFSGRSQLLGGGVFAEGQGGSRFRYEFQISESTPFALTGTLAANPRGTTQLVFGLVHSAGMIVRGVSDDTETLDESGTLEAGFYGIDLSTAGYGQSTPMDGGNEASGSFSVVLTLGNVTSVPEVAGTAPVRVYPNPVRTRATISLGGRRESGRDVVIFDAAGRRVRNLGSTRSSELTWDARDDRGVPVSSGVYFIRVGDHTLGRTTVIR